MHTSVAFINIILNHFFPVSLFLSVSLLLSTTIRITTYTISDSSPLITHLNYLNQFSTTLSSIIGTTSKLSLIYSCFILSSQISLIVRLNIRIFYFTHHSLYFIVRYCNTVQNIVCLTTVSNCFPYTTNKRYF